MTQLELDAAGIRSARVEVDGLSLHYLEAGQGPPVLLLHGWPTSSVLWRHALPKIACSRRAIALDLPGFGQSSKPLDASYSFRFYDRVITGFLEALGVDELGLVVHDLGGPIGLHWAVGNRSRITDLTLLNTLVFPEMSWAVIAFVVASKVPGLRSLLASPAGIRAAMRFGVCNTHRIDAPTAALYTEPFESRAARRALLKAAHGLHPEGFRTIGDGIGRFEIPMRLLYGTEDRILPDVAETMKRVSALCSQAELSSLEDCGHFLQEDRPDEVADLLADFLSRASR